MAIIAIGAMGVHPVRGWLAKITIAQITFTLPSPPASDEVDFSLLMFVSTRRGEMAKMYALAAFKKRT